MAFPNYFENQTSTSIADNTMNTLPSDVMQYQYSVPTDSLEFNSNNNRSDNLVNEQSLYPLIDNNNYNTSETPQTNEKSSGQFSCNNIGCNKTYATLSGLNNHIKK